MSLTWFSYLNTVDDFNLGSVDTTIKMVNKMVAQKTAQLILKAETLMCF